MKVFVVLVLAIASASAGLLPIQVPVHPRDRTTGPSIEGRITNGKDAAVDQFPYQVGLSFTGSAGSWWCGGSLIEVGCVLTAAHCTSGADSVVVYLGATIRTSPKATQTIRSSDFIQHENYNSVLIRNDIALIKIAPVSTSSSIQTIALPARASSYSTYAGQTAVASGWGLTSDSANVVSNVLKYVSLPVITNAVCQSTFGSLIVTAGTLCVSTPNGSSTCQGDSGGPLALDNIVIGVTSFGSGSGCQAGYPAAFSRTTYYREWIYSKINI
ncbi:hypothetical protein KR009_009300 [Drosophila setifemur]|nr:hypothetical protein KR009_009300 [Drosophila setifemur]